MDEKDFLSKYRFQLERNSCAEDEEILEYLESDVWMCNECGAFSREHQEHCTKCKAEKFC